MLLRCAYFFAAVLAINAQSISVAKPPDSSLISGTNYSLTVAINGAPSAYSVQYIVDGESQGIASSPFSLAWNTNSVWNGTHQLSAILRDPTGAKIAVSPPIAFITDNSSRYF